MQARNQCLAWIGLVCLAVPCAAAAEPWRAVLSNEAAWSRLPAAESGEGEPLPIWARILVQTLPATTAAMLEMDRVQRSDSGLDPRMRAEIRWVAAQANGGRYGMEQSRGDYLRAGGTLAQLEPEGLSQLSPQTQRLRSFVQRMCHSAYEVTDDEVGQLLRDWGPEQLTAIVLVLAYANFQDRLLNALQVTAEPGGPLLPPAARFDWKNGRPSATAVAERVLPAEPPDAAAVPTGVPDPAWHDVPLADLRQRLAGQQVRGSRIPIPSDEVLRARMPAELYQPGRSERIRWNSVAYGYQPVLTAAWFHTMRQFRQESGLPDELRQSAFWVVTRSNWCFY